jgi:uncharacterized protein (TIGR02466 family)
MRNTTNIFPIQIYKTSYGDVSDLCNTLLPLLEPVFEKTVKNNQASMRDNGLCSYNAERNLHQLPEFKIVVDFITEHMNHFWHELGYSGSPFLYEHWANRYPPGAFIDIHNHAPIPLTASFYLKKEPDAGDLVFENPLETTLKHQPYAKLHNRDQYHALFDYNVEIAEGDLVIFPGWLNHRTQCNRSDSDRIILGANIVHV